MAYKNYAQEDSRWADQRLGTMNGVKLGVAGCYVTAFANVAEHFGKDVTPAELDNIFTDRGLYVDGGLCVDGMLSQVYSDIQFAGVYHCENVPCDLSVFNEFNAYDHEAIVELDSSPVPGIQTHFCRLFDYDANTGVVRIVDSQDGQVVSIADRYGDPAAVIQKVVKYVGPALNVTAPVAPAPTPETAPAAPEPPATPQPVEQPAPDPQTDPLPKVDPLSPLPTPLPVNAEPLPVPVIGNNDTSKGGLRLPSRDSAFGRGLATARQVLIWFGAFLVSFGTLVQDPLYHVLVLHYAPWLIALATALAGLGALIENLLRPSVSIW